MMAWMPGLSVFRCTASDAAVIIGYLGSDKAQKISDLTIDDLEACGKSAVFQTDKIILNMIGSYL